jgi:hypothetical protein
MKLVFRSAILAAAALGAVAVTAPSPALAWYHGGVFVGISPFPVFVGPPVVYAPPAYYPYPPPVAYTPVPAGRSCYTATFACPIAPSIAPGAPCSCPTAGGGLAGGRAG